MKLDIKSFIIGILTTVNLFLLMGFDDHDEENQNGRYQVIIDSKGDQYWSWISIEDVVNAYKFCLENKNISGPVNFVSPVPITQKEFSNRFAKVFKKFSIIPAPQIAINILMGSELAHGLIFCSLRIIPEKLLKEGFSFEYPIIEDYAKALKDE